MRVQSLAALCALLAGPLAAGEIPDPRATAAEIDRRLERRYESLGVTPAARCSDEDFLRRVAFDLAGRPPKPGGVVKFAASAEADKRAKAIDIYLSGDAWAANQASYWRDVIFSHATNRRAQASAPAFETWLAGRLSAGAGWDEVTTDLLTATGDIRENGATALIAAHDANAEELAGEVSRIFLGVQIQCANCHDHPTDKWKRQDFHTLAGFFPRVRLRPMPMSTPPTAEVVSFDFGAAAGRAGFQRSPEMFFRRLDRNGDGKATKAEVDGAEAGPRFEMLLRVGDKDNDGALSLDELKSLPPPPQNQNTKTEWFMPDLENPSSPGELMRPKLFLDGTEAPVGMSDVARRRRLAEAITDPGNVWFARATVNRVWNELVGSGFYTPVDDLGPDRKAVCPDVLDLLCDGFVKSGYDLKWLLATVANTQAYQRSVRTEALVSTAADAPFAAATPTRLRADHVYAAVMQMVGEPTPPRLPFFLGRRNPGGDGDKMDNPAMAAMAFAERGPKRRFIELFGFDPSTPHEAVTGDVPQALILMNGPFVAGRVRASGYGPLARIVGEDDSPEAVTEKLYLLALSRRPTEEETRFCVEHVNTASSRLDAYEDLVWALMNSTEFVTKR